jgi:phenylacetate-CoA ligase
MRAARSPQDANRPPGGSTAARTQAWGNHASSAYTAFVANVLFPLHERLKGHASVAVRETLEASQWWPAERLQTLQMTRLRALLQHAQAHVPFYRAMFAEHDFDPAKVASTGDLTILPLLTKPLIRAHCKALFSNQAKALVRSNTGGSSGEPLVFYIGKDRVSHDVAAKWRATRWWGVDIGDTEMVVWGSPVELNAQDRVRALRDRFLRTELLPAFRMSAAELDVFIDRIRKLRPRMLFGYPSALAHIARHAAARGQRMDDLGIVVAFVTAERLYDDQRDDIARVFGCRVANGYGGRDAGFIAHECQAGGMHITAEDIVVEIVDADGKPLPAGQSGEIVITHLASKDFPFIRYRTGDVGSLDTAACPCGRSLPMLKEIQVRSTAFVVAADGTVMHGLALIYVVRDLPGIKSFRIIQESLERTRVQVVPDGNFSARVSADIVSGFRARIGQSVDVCVEQLSEISPERSGKFRYVVSHVHH